MSKRLIAFLLIVSLFLSTSLIPANAAAKAGAKCIKAGNTEVVKGKSYTCVKSGKKLFWNKGVKVVAAIPKAPTSFDDLVQNYEGIAYAAWNQTRQMISTGTVLVIPKSISVGPNTIMTNKDVNGDYATASKLWAAYNQPKQFTALYYGQSDIDWAKRTGAEQVGRNIDYEISMNCSEQRCNGANANYTSPNLLGFGVSPANSQAYHTNGGIEIHEFTHLVQYAQIEGNQSALYAYNTMPCWFREGTAHFGGIAGAASTFTEYELNRKDWLRSNPIGMTSNYEKDSVLNFLNNSCSDRYGHVYDVGYFAIEALSSVKGAGSSIELLKVINSGKTFEDAFNTIYGMSLNEALPIVAEAVSLEFKQNSR